MSVVAARGRRRPAMSLMASVCTPCATFEKNIKT